MNITRIRPRNDNVLIRMAASERKTEELLPSGLFAPRQRNENLNDSVEATVIAAGPGHYHDRWISQELGSSQDGTALFIPIDPRLVAGARVVALSSLVGDVLYSDERDEYRMVRSEVLCCLLSEEGEMLPLGDRVIVRRDEGERKTTSGIIIPESEIERRNTGTVVSVGQGKVVESGAVRDIRLAEGDRVVISQYGGTEFEGFVLLREEDVLGVEGT